LLEEVLSHAGNHISLTVIISHISNTHGGAAFGDFKATLAGLFRFVSLLDWIAVPLCGRTRASNCCFPWRSEEPLALSD
jgi:hypothetical protein